MVDADQSDLGRNLKCQISKIHKSKKWIFEIFKFKNFKIDIYEMVDVINCLNAGQSDLGRNLKI